MKTDGLLRSVDQLGRVVIPMELKISLGINSGDFVEFCTDGNKIIIKKFTTKCVICGCDKKLKTYKGKPVCKKCIERLSKINLTNIKSQKIYK